MPIAPSSPVSQPPLPGVPTAPNRRRPRSAATASAIIRCSMVPKLASMPLTPFSNGLKRKSDIAC